MTMKSLLLAGAAALLGVTSAIAADMPVRKAPLMVEPVSSWAGWYIGGHLGWSETEIIRWTDSGSTAPYSGTKSGFIGGGQIGYNWQQGSLVYGLEVDGSYLDSKLKFNVTDTFENSNNLPWLVTARVRMGLLVLSDTLAYVTGGVAFGSVTTKAEGCCPNPYSQSKSRVGWVAGGGIEHMVTRNWTIAAEALFVDLGAKTYCTKNCSNRRVTANTAIGRLKANFKF